MSGKNISPERATAKILNRELVSKDLLKLTHRMNIPQHKPGIRKRYYLRFRYTIEGDNSQKYYYANFNSANPFSQETVIRMWSRIPYTSREIGSDVPTDTANKVWIYLGES